jgi:hypothetical protein
MLLFGQITRPTSVAVSWRPPQTYLHYNELYCGIYEYLRAPPANQYRAQALEYMVNIQQNSIIRLPEEVSRMQRHRIAWIREWLKALPCNEQECSDAETDVGVEEVW